MSILNTSLILSADAYKFSHPFVISKSVDGLTSYIEARHGWSEEIVFFGLQAFIREYLATPITLEDIDRAERYAKSAFIPFYREMWEHVVTVYGGFLPITIQALPEGTPVKHGISVVQITSADTKYPGLVSVIETSLLRAIWYPSSVATLSREIKKELDSQLKRSSDLDPEVVLPTMLNDFGARGTSSGESAALGGLAHLVNFIGSDTVEAIDAAVTYYDHNLDRDGPVLVSVPATEHSVTTINGEDGESEFVTRTINIFTDLGFPIISLVADSYDLDNFVDKIIGSDNKELILNRDGFIVVRPDSGDPVTIVPHVLELLDRNFGSILNSKGYKVLNSKVRVIQGDGVNFESIIEILDNVRYAGFSVENLVFGMGGKLLQGVMRDDHSWAMKTNAVHHRPGTVASDVNWIDVAKKPKTDMSKASKAGRQAVIFYDGEYHAIREDEYHSIMTNGTHGTHNYLERVWDSGKVIRTTNLTEVRNRAKL